MIVSKIREVADLTISNMYGALAEGCSYQINQTKPEFEGDYTIVLFSLVKPLKKSPDTLGQELGMALIESNPTLFSAFNVIKGFLNLTISTSYWLDIIQKQADNTCFGLHPKNGKKVMVEYSSPNTNKPLHLGHLRNNFLGWSIAEILKAGGYDVIKSCIVNDRGIHICKSMIAWEWFGNGSTPASTGIKGDHFVGDYYVKFNDAYKAEVESLIASGISKDIAEKEAPIMKAAQQMLVDWEAGKPDVINVWKTMNGWVYEGFDTTYKRIGSDFDRTYYESETYILGKKMVEEGLSKNIFQKKEDGSVSIDLTADGLDEKIVQRKDGTAVYITQDIGLAIEKYNEYTCDESIYVVGDEQNYHFKVLKLICEKLGLPSAEGIYHLSYGMVELPSGKMKSREGTVVDADDLVDEMVRISAEHTEALGKVKDFSSDELKELYLMLGLGALKFFLLRVDPKKKMIFNPEESIDFHGFTGPFVQYTHARIRSILRKESPEASVHIGNDLLPLEKELIVQLERFGMIIEQAVAEHNPSLIAIYVFDLAKLFNSFYAEHSVTQAESNEKKQLRLKMSQITANVIKSSMSLLGIKVPERM
ncbi:MAG: arginine--tRNA ligase [Chitinophagaceae bacterium]